MSRDQGGFPRGFWPFYAELFEFRPQRMKFSGFITAFYCLSPFLPADAVKRPLRERPAPAWLFGLPGGKINRKILLKCDGVAK